MKSIVLISIFLISNFANARLPDELQGPNSVNIPSAPWPTGAVSDPSFSLNINTVKCMPRAEEIMKLLEVSFMFGPTGRSTAAGMIHKIQSTPSQIQGLSVVEILGYAVAAQSLTPRGRAQLKQSTTIDCSLIEAENQTHKEINESALKILKLFVDNPLTGR